MFELSDMNSSSVTSGVGRWQSEKDITSAPALALFTLNLRIVLLPFQPVNPLDLIMFLPAAEASLCL